jgi:hypothetical protein
MSNLTTTNGFSPLEVEAMQKLNDYLKTFIEVKNEVKIIHQDKQEILTQLYAILIKTIELSGENKKYNLDNQTVKNVAGYIYDYVLQNYKGATLSELKKAFKMGISGEFGDFVGFGTVTFTKFIKGYMTYPKRDQAIKDWFRNQTPQTTDKPVTKFFNQNMDIANYFFENFDIKYIDRYDTILNHNDQVMFLPSIFEFLNDNYKVVFSKESTDAITHKAKIRYNKFLVESKIKTKDPKGYDNLVQSVINGTNRTFEYYFKLECLLFMTMKLKESGKTYKDLKPNV